MEKTTATGVAQSRRSFLRGTAASVAGAAALAAVEVPAVHAAGSDVLRVGLVGCGGRGSGAAKDAMGADSNAKLVALGDAFKDQLDAARGRFEKGLGRQYAVADDHCFVGFDAYKKVIDAVDVVLLASPPHFRPLQLEYAVAQGKHAFVEKPMAVDGPGVRSVLASCRAAQEKGLSIVAGFCWRYHQAMRETVKRVRDGQVGQIIAMQTDYNTRRPRLLNPRQPSWSDMEFQLRNWYFYAWLSGDHNVEQHVHSLDKMAWVMGDEYPVRAYGMGGRQAIADNEPGHIYDHHAVCYEFANGVRCYSFCRQQNGTYSGTEDWVYGTKGTAALIRHKITGASPWSFGSTRGIDMYQQEHNELFASIRNGKPINDGEWMAKSTLMAIMGRMATYTGQLVTWEQALGSNEELSPPKYDWIELPEPPVAIPGVTKLA